MKQASITGINLEMHELDLENLLHYANINSNDDKGSQK